MPKSIRSSITSIAILMIILEFAVIKPAHAYIDPGTGSYLFSVGIALVCGAGYALKTFWGRIMQYFERLRDKNRGR